MDKARREGFVLTIQTAFDRLDQPMALGYSSAGTIVALGKNMQGFKVGTRGVRGRRLCCSRGIQCSATQSLTLPSKEC